MRKFVALATVAAVLSSCGLKRNCLKTTPEKPVTITIIHMNDIHSHLKSDRRKLLFNEKKYYVYMGGLNRAITKIKELQRQSENPVILNAGDMIQGTLYYVLFHGNATADLLNLIKWDAVTIGNHEFDNGDRGLKLFLDRLKAPVVSANIVPEKDSSLYGYWKPYRIIKRDGEKIGIIGIGYSQKTKNSSNPGKDIKFLDEKATVRKYISELKNKGVDKIIVLSHFGMKNDISMAKEVKGIDVIIDGDSHSLLGNYTAYGLKSAYPTYPVTVKSPDGKKVCVASAWEYGYAVGDLKVKFDADGNVIDCNGVSTVVLKDKFLKKENGKKVPVSIEERIAIGKEIAKSDGKLEVLPADKDATRILARYSSKVDRLKKQVIGVSAQFLGHNRIPGDKWDGVSYLPEHGSEIAPLVAKSFYLKVKDADIAIQNAGGVRTPLDEGNITIGEVYKMLPFSNTLYTIKMTGKEVKQVLEDAISNFMDKHGSTGSFPYVYGIRYDVDLSKPYGSRVYNIEIMERRTGIWHPIKMNKLYTVVTNSYVASGKDGYVTFVTAQKLHGKGVNTYFGYAESFVDMVKNLTAQRKKLKELPLNEKPVQHFRR
ncbi:NAD nucleotidase [Desulfurobacterium indicum]|uniref:NAD nucleotidase n=1 Tax=Desulfurobacterium indicum TaxID=1914305 RepID=A0A1R1MMX5_9BACT|nr:NAD nucleotidase [Desulfurobacterium indicum]OMH41126.1 NAD nucleotidase [Desulfurobacterium indicum]